MLDLKQMARTIEQLQAEAVGPQAEAGADAAQPPTPPGEVDIDALIAAIRSRGGAEARPGLIETGFSMLGTLLRKTLS